MSRNYRLLVKNAKQVVLICNNGEKFMTKHEILNLCVIENGSIVIGRVGGCSHSSPGGRLLHGRAPGGGGDPLHGGAHPGCGPPELLSSLSSRLLRMQRAGTTLVECKSGYGLDLHTELKMLQVIEEARNTLPINISSTYCGAHAVPKLKEQMSAGTLRVDNIDVFCEEGVFDLSSTRRILQAGKDLGLNINFHGDELHPMNSAQLGAELGASAISHLEEPRARDMLEAGVIVALGSDFNPNAYCCSMPIVMHLACVNMRMSMPEALAAATINAAYALGCSHTHGSLEVNKHGDLLVLNTTRWEHLIYQLGGHQELIRYVIIKGNIVVDNDKTLDL
ncbi:hypothetical protein F7725_021740 [Dissostichus mawsoni]|uniref:Probable imidazolonepropionase n=1 Tax=Dissostichus mawsoni TaxID=36200 RepID=A0A7J5ZE09_DISMA|nr:hypothetical protein F7725_021740 [Dissostichus mawsoni]